MLRNDTNMCDVTVCMCYLIVTFMQIDFQAIKRALDLRFVSFLHVLSMTPITQYNKP